MSKSELERIRMISRRHFLQMGFGAATGTLLGRGLPMLAHSGDLFDEYSGSEGDVIRGVRTNARRVCLTVDDLWSEYYTLRICREYHKRNIRLTLFPVGRVVQNNLERPTPGHEDLYPRLQDMGHEFGCHLYTHRVVKEFSLEQLIEEELEPSLAAMKRALGSNFEPVGIRPPYGHVTNALRGLSQQYRIPLVLWGLDSQDAICTQQNNRKDCECPQEPNIEIYMKIFGRAPRKTFCKRDNCAEECVDKILRSYESYLRPGTIILHHALEASLLAIPSTVGLLEDWNMQAIPLSELLTYASGSGGA